LRVKRCASRRTAPKKFHLMKITPSGAAGGEVIEL
jgi:hypothetical protein